jgi:hypothetical protein
MKFTFEYNTFHLSTSIYKKELSDKLKQSLIDGGIVWLNAARAIIPIWSGAAHGTFLKLAQKLGTSFSIGGGVSWLTGPAYGEARSAAKLTTWGGSYILEYSTSLWHLVYNEYNNANANKEESHVFSSLKTPTPYHFQERAGAMFRDFASRVRLPSPWVTMKIKFHKVG